MTKLTAKYLKTAMRNLKAAVKTILKRIYAASLRGSKFYCPICEKGYRSFLPAGIQRRPNAVCPGCGAFERHRLLWIAFENLIERGLLTAHGRLLHVAAETAIAGKLKASAVFHPYVMVDLTRRDDALPADIRHLPFQNDSFDAVICNHVLEHVPDDRKALSELWRVMKPGGWASLQVPISGSATLENPAITEPAERERVFGQADHVRRYGYDYPVRLEAAGFRIRVLSKNDLADGHRQRALSLECENEVIFAWK